MTKKFLKNIVATDDSNLACGCRRYLQWLAIKNYSPRTIMRHSYSLNYFLHWAKARYVTALSQITGKEIEQYANELLAMERRPRRPLSVNYRHHQLQVLKAFFDWLADNGTIERSPARHIKLPPFKRRPLSNILGHHAIEAIISQPDIGKLVGIRDRAILEMLYSTGIRRREVVTLELDDVNLHSGVVYVRDGKGRKQRLVPIGERALEWLNKYLYEARPVLLNTRQCNALFITYKGQGFSCSGLAHTIAPYVRAAGEHGCCHIFRHAMATAMMNNGAEIAAIQEILGHEDLSSTQVYTHVQDDKLREIYARSHPACDSDPAPLPVSKPLYRWGGKPGQPKTTGTPLPCCELTTQVSDYCRAMAPTMKPATIDKRRRQLARFVRWCDLRAIHQPHQITHSLLERYHKDLYRQRHQDKPLNPSYIGRHLIAVRCFCAWLNAGGIIIHDPARKIRLPKRMKTIPHQILTQEEIAKIMAQVDTTDPLGARDRAILELLWATGAQTQELCNLALDDLDLTNDTIRIAQRRIPITTAARCRLQIYLEQARPQLAKANAANLFLSRYGTAISPTTLRDNIKHYIQQAGIKKPGICTLFRRTLAATLLEQGVDIRHVQQILGHRNLNSTQIYTKASIRKLKEVHTQTHPAAILHDKPETPDAPTTQAEPK